MSEPSDGTLLDSDSMPNVPRIILGDSRLGDAGSHGHRGFGICKCKETFPDSSKRTFLVQRLAEKQVFGALGSKTQILSSESRKQITMAS